jgi:hypothetical protein
LLVSLLRTAPFSEADTRTTHLARYQWLTTIILATWEAEIGRIPV